MSDDVERMERRAFEMRNVDQEIRDFVKQVNSAPPTECTRARVMTLPTDSAERKEYPMLSGCLKYFPAALAGVANVSKQGNDKHNPGQPLHHARSKSMDHGDCIIRHLTDTEDLLANLARGAGATSEQILLEVNQLTWRVLAYSQQLHEQFGAPLAPAAVIEPAKPGAT